MEFKIERSSDISDNKTYQLCGTVELKGCSLGIKKMNGLRSGECKRIVNSNAF